MGLPTQIIRFLIREHKRCPLPGPILTLGRQQLHCSAEEIPLLLAGRRPHSVAGGTASPALDLDKALFSGLTGHALFSLDISDYEGSEIIHDLNLPVPEALHGRFGTIIDGGTTEHVFHAGQALLNIAAMLKPGGRIIHITPACGYVGHGFFQFSPNLFFDFYTANNFSGLRCYLAFKPDRGEYQRPWRLYEWKIGRSRANLPTRCLVEAVFIAEKTVRSSSNRVPTQGLASTPAFQSPQLLPPRYGSRPRRALSRLRELILHPLATSRRVYAHRWKRELKFITVLKP